MTTPTPTPTLDETVLNQWIGREQVTVDRIDPRPALAMQATLDREPCLREGDHLPALWHWLYFPALTRRSELGRDGHARLGGFLPPVALARRMWAGGRFEFVDGIRLGEVVTKTSKIHSIALKHGRSGNLCFVTVRHEFMVDERLCFSEEHDIVYREDPSPDASRPQPPPAPRDAHWQREIQPDPVLLFRYSALTFNGHRIHYDRSYCTEVEGYAGLVFHGPLTATLLVDLAVSTMTGRSLKAFEFRAVSPLLDTEAFQIAGRAEGQNVQLWAGNGSGQLAMSAKARFE